MRKIVPSKTLMLMLTAYWLSGCASSPPKSTDNICNIFKEKSGWYKDARAAEKKWNSPIPVMMSIMHQESGFNANAKPARSKILWIFPGPRPSSSFGYSQAKKEAWKDYRRATGQGGADRDDFDDAIDFIGWYDNQSHRRNGIADNDAYNLYLAYHEGQGGYEKRTYKNKKWLLDIAKKVSARSARYDKQLASCRKELEGPWWWPF